MMRSNFSPSATKKLKKMNFSHPSTVYHHVRTYPHTSIYIYTVVKPPIVGHPTQGKGDITFTYSIFPTLFSPFTI